MHSACDRYRIHTVTARGRGCPVNVAAVARHNEMPRPVEAEALGRSRGGGYLLFRIAP